MSALRFISGLFPVFLILSLTSITSCSAGAQFQRIRTGAENTEAYFPLLKGKRVAVVANPTSVIGKIHLVDTLLKSGIAVRHVFAPEHGFRGEAEAGEDVKGNVDLKTGLKIISLYGDRKKPAPSDLDSIDAVIFDIQDVGVRFYTYISTLQYVMEACASHDLPLYLLDRPNPHGSSVDGPVLDTAFSSFVGMQPVPVTYGMTIGEYAMMLNGERWLGNGLQCELHVVRMTGWTHASGYDLPVPPSPNLPNSQAIRLYPSLCFFEGARVSLGRGTDKPFQCYGYPGNPSGSYRFTPRSIPGKALKPPFEGQECSGEDLSSFASAGLLKRLDLRWLLRAYHTYPDKSSFFIPFFDKLAGTDSLRKQIAAGMSEEYIRESWEPGLRNFRMIRSKYLLYPEK